MNDSSVHNVFLLDDHPLVLEGLQRLIRAESDLRVCGTASDGQAMLEALTTAHVEILVMDLSLKNENGLDLIARVQEIRPHLPVLVLSMHEEMTFVERALASGARGYVTKSQATEEVLDAIRQLLAGKTFLSPSLLRQLLERREAPPLSPESTLSSREMEIFRLLGQGYSTRAIAGRLAVSPKTVDSHCANIKSKLKLAGARELVQKAALWAHEHHSSGREDMPIG